MPRRSYISSFKRLPWAVIIAFLLMVLGQNLAFNSKAFWAYFYRNSSPRTDDAFRFEAVARNSRRGAGFFFLGASQARENVDTRMLKREFGSEGIRFYNLGISNAHAMDLYMTIDRVLDARPTHIVLISDLNMISSRYMYPKLRPYFNHDAIPAIVSHLGFREVWRERVEFLHSFLGEMFPFYRFRESIGRILKDEVSISVGASKRKPFLRFAYSKRMNTFDEKILNERLAEQKQGRGARPEEVSMNEWMFESCVKKITEMGIPLLVVDAPYYPGVKEGYFSKLFAPYHSFMILLSEKYGFPYFSDADLNFLEREDFVDHTHLTRSGRIKFTKFISELIREQKWFVPQIGGL